MYKVIAHWSNGQHETIAPFPSETMDFYSLLRLIDKCVFVKVEILPYNPETNE